MKDKKPRSDKMKNVGKVAQVLAENPQASEREIAEKIGIGHGTVNRAKQEIEQTGSKDPTITYIVNSAKERIKTISRVLDHKTKKIIEKVENDEELDNKDIYLLKEIAKDDQARVTVFGGSITDEKGGARMIDPKEYATATPEQLAHLIKQFTSK